MGLRRNFQQNIKLVITVIYKRFVPEIISEKKDVLNVTPCTYVCTFSVFSIILLLESVALFSRVVKKQRKRLSSYKINISRQN